MALSRPQQGRFERLQRRKAAGKDFNRDRLQKLKGLNRAPDVSRGRGPDVFPPQGIGPMAPPQGVPFQGSGTDYFQSGVQQANPFMDMMGSGGGWNNPYQLGQNEKQDAKFNKFMAKMPQKLINAYGGPGQAQAGTATAGWYGGLTPEQQQQVAAFAFANRNPRGGDPYAQTPTGSPRTWGNMMNSVFPGLKDTYSGSLHGMTGEEWGALTPQQMQKLRMDRGPARRGSGIPPAPPGEPVNPPPGIPTLPHDPRMGDPSDGGWNPNAPWNKPVNPPPGQMGIGIGQGGNPIYGDPMQGGWGSGNQDWAPGQIHLMGGMNPTLPGWGGIEPSPGRLAAPDWGRERSLYDVVGARPWIPQGLPRTRGQARRRRFG